MKQLLALCPHPGLCWRTETHGLSFLVEFGGIKRWREREKSGMEALLHRVTFAPAVVMSGLLVIAVTGGWGGGGGSSSDHPVRSQGSN